MVEIANDQQIEMLKHLRQVHFYIVLLCTLLITATSFSDSSLIDESIDQAKKIKHMSQKWRTNNTDQLLVDEGSRLLDQNQNITSSLFGPKGSDFLIEIKKENSGLSEDLHFKFSYVNSWSYWGQEDLDWPLEQWSDSRSIPALKQRIRVNSHSYSLPTPATLEEFKNIWDFLHRDRFVYVFERIKWNESQLAYVERDNNTGNLLSIERVATVSPTNSITTHNGHSGGLQELGVLPISSQDFEVLGLCCSPGARHYYYSGEFRLGEDNRIMELIVPVESRKFRLNGQSLINEKFGFSLRSGDFSTTFRELDIATENIKELAISKVLEQLKAEKERIGGGLEILGAKLPAIAVRNIGLTLLVVVLLYFLLHLNQFNTIRAPRYELGFFPWVALYPAKMALVATAMTLVALPAMTGIFLVFNFWGDDYLPFMVFSLIECGFLAIIIYRVTVEIFRLRVLTRSLETFEDV